MGARKEVYQDHLEQLVRQRTGQLESINKDLEAFAYSISHDLRAPIRHINGFTSFLKKKLDPATPEIRDYLEMINQASRRMGDMIDALLNFSRLGRRELLQSEVNLNQVVKEVIHNFEPDIRQRKVEWKIGVLPTVHGDQNLLKIAFENLIANAIKYTQNEAVAVIEVGHYPEEEPPLYTVYIKDNGVGFDMTYADKLFGVFQRLHKEEEFEGTGIGLANVQQILQKHGGCIRAEGAVGRGATFYMTIQN